MSDPRDSGASVDLTTDLRDLVTLANEPGGSEELMRRGLDWLSRLAPYDLAAIFTLEGERLQLALARGPLAHEPKVRNHSLELRKFPSIREALETRRARAFLEDDHAHGDGDPFDGVLDLPHGHSCMVVPLYSGDEAQGLLTLDRRQCVRYAPEVVNLAEVYGQILAMALRQARHNEVLRREHDRERTRARLLEDELGGGSPELVLETSRSPAVRQVVQRARQVAATPTPVLILGETGTGKERLARAIHAWSPRAERPFVTINCAAIPPALIESELFGHVKGAFTGAEKERAGRFQVANGGTLFLDEIGELPLELQAKLLRATQEQSFQPVGSDKTVRVDVRLLAATHVDLKGAVREGRFREDLFYRLNVFPLELPPLRERLEDLPLLAEALLREHCRRAGRSLARLLPAALTRLMSYPWPGNIRELSNVLERATILSPGPELGVEAIDLGGSSRPGSQRLPPVAAAETSPSQPEEVLTLAELQRRYIEQVLGLTGGKIYGAGGAAELLGLKPSTLQSRMKKLGVQRPG